MKLNSKSKKIISACVCIVLLLGAFSETRNVYASESTFEISVMVTDGILPTAPTNLVATAVSTSQINLSWDAGTASAGILHYKIYRDGVFIGTTADLFFYDTDLEANTLYEYRVSTVDNATNESPLSDSVLVTTPKPVVGPPGGSSLIFININIATQPDSAVINWITNRATLGTVLWGKTKDYELGSIQSKLYIPAHNIKISDLESDTLYYIKIQSVDAFGRQVVAETTFQTKSLPDFTPPSNPINFVAIQNDSSIDLSWNNPPDKDLKEIRIIRSDIFYPKDVLDGKEIYRGLGESYIDRDVEKGKLYFYTIFAVDKNGNYASGAIAHARISLPGEAVDYTPYIYDFLPKSPIVDQMIEELSLLDFEFIQEGKILSFEQNTVSLTGDKPFTVRLPYEKVPEVLKTISVTLYDPIDPSKVFSFLLRINKEKNGYEAVIAPLGRSGNYGMHISILDHKNQGLKKIDGNLVASLVSAKNFVLVDMMRGFLITLSEYFWFILFVLLLVWFLRKFWLLLFKKKKRCENLSNDTNNEVEKSESNPQITRIFTNHDE